MTISLTDDFGEYQRRLVQRFIPPGYVGHNHVLEAVQNHLFPNLSDEDAEKMPAEKRLAGMRRCLHFLRSILCEAKTPACYALPGQGMVLIKPSFWLGGDCDRLLFLGEVEIGFGFTPLLFVKGEIERILSGQDDEQEAKETQAKIGRPEKATAALAVYQEVYPLGHELSGATWKAVAKAVSARLGESVSVDTLQKALKAEVKVPQNSTAKLPKSPQS